MKLLATALLFLVILAPVASVGQSDDSSLQTIDSESSEVSALVALEKLLAENRKLRGEAEEARKLAANATAEAEIFKRQVQELALRMEALGTSTADPSKLEQRLLQAVHDLQLSEKNRRAVSAELLRIAELAHAYLAKPDAESKLVLETELRKADETLVQAAVGDFAAMEKGAAEPAADLLNGRVSAVKPELGCVVINLGVRHGVKAGMPFQIRRGSKVIATVRVVDARQTFAGTVIQNLVSEKEPIRLGDSVRVDAQLN
ncbi:MAG: hypothetical protein ABMA01_02170 [Chthoniobacteraceae bacterium]